MTLEELGFQEKVQQHLARFPTEGLSLGRVVSEQKERYLVLTKDGEFPAEITGTRRFSAQSREDFPAVGDWVLLSVDENDFSVIHHILPRYSIIKRRAVDSFHGVQILGTNIDYALILQAADRDFNLNRLERYLTICSDSQIQSIIVVSKIDLVSEATRQELQDAIETRLSHPSLVFLSNRTSSGLDVLREIIQTGKTYCLLGSSGVGKSTLLNHLLKNSSVKTGEISRQTNKGKHTTSSRNLYVLESGGVFIDSPGMREVGMADSEEGIERTFEQIVELSQDCLYADCRHIQEKGCAVLEAVEQGRLGEEVYENYIKLKKESDFFQATKAEKRKKDRDFGKLKKEYAKNKTKYF